MPSSTFYNEVLTDHNLYPAHKKPLPGANMTLEGVNPSCGDDIILQLKVENGKIEAGALQDISHMPARVKCAVLGWHTMEKLLDHKDEQ